MNPSLIALASAISWGSSDFLGGIAAKRISPSQAVAAAHAFSLLCILAAIGALHLPVAHGSTLVIGLVAGLFGGLGLILFYEALSLGAMGLIAAIAGVLTAAVPVIYGIASEGFPRPRQLVGFVLAVVAIWLIAAAPSSTSISTRNLWLGAIAGSCFGIYFVLLKLAVSFTTAAVLAPALWAVTCSRVTSATLALAVCGWTALHPKPSQPDQPISLWGWQTLAFAMAIGLLDLGGNLFYVLSARLGRMDIAAVLSSLYPAVTILLAVLILKERTSRSQTAGMALALAAVGLIAV